MNFLPIGLYRRLGVGLFFMHGVAMHSETRELFVVVDSVNKVEALPLSSFARQENGRPVFEFEKEGERNFPESSILPVGNYKHFKSGNDERRLYKVYGIVTSSHENREVLVLYRPLYGSQMLMLRPLSMFAEIVKKPEYQYEGPRFYRV